MSKLMSVLGIVLLAIGLALGLVGLVSPAQMQILGLSMDTAAILLTGGVLSIGLGGVIAALDAEPRSVVTSTTITEVAAPVMVEKAVEEVQQAVVEEPAAPPLAPAPMAPAAEEAPARIRFNPFGRKGAEAGTAVLAGAAATAAVVASPVQEAAAATVATGKSAVDDTIAALEQAKADIANAVGGIATVAEDKVEEVVDEIDEEIPEADDIADGELYVLEEREIRGRPARILSDNTVEAETDEGWMRFENLEHLNEYLDAMGEPA